MFPDIQWPLLMTEIGLIALAGICIVLDLVLPKTSQKGQILASSAMTGLVVLIIALGLRWGHFGMCFFGSFAHDGLSYFFKMLFLVAGFFVLHMVREYQPRLKKGHAEFVILILFALIGMSFLISANEFLLFFVALETLTISLYIITSYLREDEHSIEAGIKFFILGALATAMMVYGLSFVYGATGSTTYLGIQEAMTFETKPSLAFIFGMTLIVAALGFKIAIVPCHSWVPDVYEGAPTPITAFLAMGSKTAGFAALCRLMMTVFMPAQGPKLVILLGVLAALTILYGNLGAIPQKNIKRLLAYSSIGHAGYLLMGLAAFWQTGKEALLFYLACYLFSTAGAFLVVVWISQRLNTDNIDDYAGLSQRSPLLAAGMLLAVCSLAGVPPLAGFFAKFYVIAAAVKAHLLWLALIGAVNVVIALFYYLRIVKVMYVDRALDESPWAVPLSQKIVQYISIAGIVLLGIYPGPLISFVDTAFLNFLRF